MEKTDLVYKTTAAKMLGISIKKFDELDIEHKKEVPNPHYRSGGTSFLFSREEVENLIGTEAVEALKSKPRKRKDWASVFEKKYEGKEKEVILLEAAQGLFNLNRYCKHSRCTRSNRDEIYQLKNTFIRKMYRSGYSESVKIHKIEIGAQECYTCNGTGKCDYEGSCYNCNGTGNYRQGKVLKFAVFAFLINDTRFVWHQPMEKVGFEFEVTDSEESEINETEVKPLEVKRSKLTELKALLKWVISEY